MKKDKYLVLVNRDCEMINNQDYELVKCNSKYNQDCYLEKETYHQFLKFKKYIAKQGYIIDIESGYRSKETQQEVWQEILKLNGLEYTKKFVAVPGFSEHQSGLAINFILYENGKFYEDNKMRNHPIVDLVASSAHQFGFVIRYPYGKENITKYGYEPWHLRYVGLIPAKYMYEKKLCLEEYLERK